MVQASGNTAGEVVSEPLISRVLVTIRAFCLELLPPGTPVLQTRQNNTPVPNKSFVLLSVLSRQNLTTGGEAGTANTLDLSMPEEFVVQVSLFGETASDNARRLATAFRTEWACQFFDTLARQTLEAEKQAGPSVLVQEWLQKTPPAADLGEVLPVLPVPLAIREAAQRPIRLMPLFAGEIRQMPFVNGEQQYEQHWFLTLHCQTTSHLILPQTTASSASIMLTSTEALSSRESSV